MSDAFQTQDGAGYRRCATERRVESLAVADTRPPAAFPPPSGEVPDDWTELIDVTGTLGISVPSTWTATDVSPVPCGGTASRIVELVANPRLGSVTVVLLVQLTGRADDAATLDGLLSAFVDFSGFDTTPALHSGPLAVIQQVVQSRFGISISADQASCLVDHDGEAGPASEPAMLVTLEAAASTSSTSPAAEAARLLNPIGAAFE